MSYCNTRSMPLAAAVFSVALFAVAPHALATIILDNNPNQSTVQAMAAFDSANGNQATNDVTALPYTGPTTSTDGPSTSTTTALSLSSSELSLLFEQHIPDYASSSGGEGIIYFTAGANTSYSIFGSALEGGDGSTVELLASLKDLTSDTSLYKQDIVFGAGTATLNGLGGSLTGTLISGDAYEFDASAALHAFVSNSGLPGAQGLSAQASIDFGSAAPVPEPGTVGLLGLGLARIVTLRRRRQPAIAV